MYKNCGSVPKLIFHTSYENVKMRIIRNDDFEP